MGGDGWRVSAFDQQMDVFRGFFFANIFVHVRSPCFTSLISPHHERQIFTLTAPNISSAALATNLDGLTMAIAGLQTASFFAYDPLGRTFNLVWNFTPPVPPKFIERLSCLGARHIEQDDPGLQYNLTRGAVDGIVAVQYDSDRDDQIALYGVRTNASAGDHLAQWRYLVTSASRACMRVCVCVCGGG
jgi:hypothetical protein